MIQRLRNWWSFLLTKLNAFATSAFLYLSVNQQLPPQAEALIQKLHEPWQMTVRLLLPFAWWSLIEFAKSKAIKKAVSDAA